MKVFVLGGGGYIGVAAISDLVKADQVSQIIAGDMNLEKVKGRLAKRKINGKVSFQQINLNDHQALVKAIKGCDVVVNCAGPFYQTAVKAAKAAIEAGISYIDVCDDWDGAQGTLALDKEAKDAGVTLITGLGVDPGTVNILAKYGASKLDQVDKVFFYWVVGLGRGEGGVAALDHIQHMLTGDIPQYLDGKLVFVPGGSESEWYEFPEPAGKCEIFYVGHSETVTIPLYLKGVKEVKAKGGMMPLWANQLFKDQAEFGLTSEKPLKVGETYVVPSEVLIACRKEFPVKRELGTPIFAFAVIVEGRKEGKAISYIYDQVETAMMPESTGFPASIGAQMLGSGEIKEKGAFAPEGCIDPKAYFKELAKRNLFIFRETVRQDL